MLASIITFFVVLSILVLVHEFGHFWMAKRAGVKVEEFGFGIPPRIFGIKKGETLYSINLLPFGGFVKLHGENPPASGEEEINPKRAFITQNKRIRIGIIVAGVIMNFLLAIFCFAITYSFTGIPKERGYVEIVGIISDSPASSTGIVVGQKIVAIDGKTVVNSDEVTEISNKGGKHTLLVEDLDRQQKKVVLNTKYNEQEKKWYMGLVLTSDEIYFPPVWQRPFYGAYYGTKEAIFWGKNVLVGFGTMVVSLFKGQAPKDLAGPVGIYAITSQAAKMGILTLINFVGILSVNLAILNILPIPALDGGRLLFIVIEGVVGKKVLPKIENAIHAMGFIILILLLVAVTAHDVRNLIAAGSIANFLNSMMK